MLFLLGMNSVNLLFLLLHSPLYSYLELVEEWSDDLTWSFIVFEVEMRKYSVWDINVREICEQIA